MTTHLTVAICTWNRAALLERALRCLANLAIPPDVSWEVVVVDNGSTDRTSEVVAAMAGALPLRSVVEPESGLSHARNAAVRAARGHYILWTDDDVFVDQGWLAAYAGAFARHPEAAVFGGPIEPAFEGSPPSWLAPALPALGNAYALLDLGPRPIPFSYETLPFGANYAITAEVQRRHPYDPELGRSRDRLLAGEETAVVRAVLAEGHGGWWVPEARVQHFIPAERQSLRYLRDYYRGNAHSAAWIALTAAPDTPFILGRPRWIWRQALESELRYRLHRLARASSALWAPEFRRASEAWGLLRAIDTELVYWARLENERQASAASASVAGDRAGRPAAADRVAPDALPRSAASGQRPAGGD